MLKEQIKIDTTTAQKTSNELVVGTLRMLLASVISKEKERRYKIATEKPDTSEENLVKESELTDEQILEVISSEIKKRRDAIVLYEQGKRPELAKKEKDEIEILQKYLPAQLSLEEIKKLVEESISSTGAKEMKDMGKVMADLNPKVKGRAEGGQVSKIVKELLSK
jgi:uncharacterized protein